jgi:heme/copper-type cytochrome/quinol oxidase subunit 3
MTKNKYFAKIFFSIVFVCFTSLTVSAQEDFGDDTNDTTPPASIDFYTPILLASAIGLGCFVLNKKMKTNKV